MTQNYPAIITAAFFEKNGAPALGLTPAICIYQITSVTGSPQGDTLVIGTETGSPIVPMSEIGKGFYKYIFTGYDSEIKYAYQIDGEAGGTGAKLGHGRYAVGTNENFAEDIAHEVWEEPKNLHLTGSPETMGSVINQIFNSTVGSPQGTGPSFTVADIVAGVWGEILTGSPRPYPPGSSGELLALISETTLTLLNNPSSDFGGSPQINIANTVWSTIVNGSPLPFPVGSAGNTIFLTNETVNNTSVAIENLTTLLFGSPATTGSPATPLTVTNIVSGVWNELLAGSPAPYPTGSAGGLINQIAQSAGLTPAQVTAAVWDVSAADYPSSGSPETMGSLHTLTTANTISILDYSEALLAAQYNRTRIDKTAFTLTIYDTDNTTPVRVFSLRDEAGNPSITEICDRVPISGSPLLPLP